MINTFFFSDELFLFKLFLYSDRTLKYRNTLSLKIKRLIKKKEREIHLIIFMLIAVSLTSVSSITNSAAMSSVLCHVQHA